MVTLILLAGASTLGVLLLALRLSAIRRARWLRSLHLLAGTSAAAATLWALLGAAPTGAGSRGWTAGLLLVMAVMLGLLLRRAARQSQHVLAIALTLHVSLAATGAVLAAAWVLHPGG